MGEPSMASMGAPSPASSVLETMVVSRSLDQARLCVVVLAFSGFIFLDVFRAIKRKAIWIPPGALVLSAFTLQLLDILDDSNVSIGDHPDSQKYDLQNLARKNLLVDGGRVIVCIYMAYLLPSMACSEENGIKLWGDIRALAISLLSHITSELYVFKQQSAELCINKGKTDELCIHMLSVVFRLCVLVCSILLFIFLASAVFAGRTIYNVMVQKIPFALSTQEGSSPEFIKHDVLQSWLVVWVSKPDYIIARSVLSSAVGVVTTICAVFYGVEYITYNYKSSLFHDGIDWLRYTTTGLKCVLILGGWLIIFCRWITSVIYFPKQWTYSLHVEDFWRRHFLEMINEIEFPRRRSWEQQVSSLGFLGSLKLEIRRVLLFHKWLLPLFLRMQILTIWFSKLSCFLSQVILTVLCMPRVHHNIDKTFRDPLEKLTMPGETAEMLCIATVKAFEETENFMRKGYEDAIRTNGNLVALMVEGSSNLLFPAQLFLSDLERAVGLEVENDFMTMKRVSCKMTMLSLIRIMMALGATDEHLERALSAYDEAYPFLDLVECPDFSGSANSADKVYTNAAEKEYTVLEKAVKCRMTDGTEEARTIIEGLRDNARNKIEDIYTPKDSVDWWEAASNNSLYKICTAILNHQAVESISHNSMESLLGDVFRIKVMEEAGRALVEKCREWAKEMIEEKIRAAVYITGRLDGVIQEFNNKANGPTPPTV